MHDKPRRRWFRYSLRTFFVLLTLFGIWLAWQFNLLHQRQATRRWVERNGGTVDVWVRPEPLTVSAGSLALEITSYQRVHGPEEEPEIPAWRRLLGDEAINQIMLHASATKTEEARVKRLFPEAKVELIEENGAGSGFF